MASRLLLQTLLENLLGSRNVYFQPPSSVNMKYPAIVYKLDDLKSMYADDGVYRLQKRYQIVVIDSNPDSVIPDKVASLPTCRFERSYQADRLNHTTFTLFY